MAAVKRTGASQEEQPEGPTLAAGTWMPEVDYLAMGSPEIALLVLFTKPFDQSAGTQPTLSTMIRTHRSLFSQGHEIRSPRDQIAHHVLTTFTVVASARGGTSWELDKSSVLARPGQQA
jgi:hypothetical protein